MAASVNRCGWYKTNDIGHGWCTKLTCSGLMAYILQQRSARLGLLLWFVRSMLQLSVWGVSTMPQTSNSMFGGIYSLVRLIFAAEERLFTLVLFPPLQVCYTLFSILNIVLFPPLQSPWVPVTPGSHLSCLITGLPRCQTWTAWNNSLVLIMLDSSNTSHLSQASGKSADDFSLLGNLSFSLLWLGYLSCNNP
jgi:hypothetical protein